MTWTNLPDIDTENADDRLRRTASTGSCGTAACVAGWAVAAAPPSLTAGEGWYGAGAKALGIDYDLALAMFDGECGHERLVEAFRWCADEPEGGRTIRFMADVALDDPGAGYDAVQAWFNGEDE